MIASHYTYMLEILLPDWSHAFGGPSGSGDIKTRPDDFIVDEIPSFTPEGSGEHVFLHIEKSGENTEYVARLLARHAGVRQRDIGYAGMKDRHGRTSQWFSVWLPGKDDPDWSALESENLKILAAARHARKLKRGVLAGNLFRLLVRNTQIDQAKAEQQLQSIKRNGFPNYFGEQRFGHRGQNIDRALTMFAGAKTRREQQSIYLSAARAYLFNLILSERVKAGSWNQALPGEIFKLDQTNSHFYAPAIDDSLSQRLASGDIHPTAVLWGKGDSGASEDALRVEQQIIAAHQTLAEGLIKAGLESDRRALRVIPQDFIWQFEDERTLRLAFRLPAGSYATSLLREVLVAQE
ncbi:MAG: tRNA pseudouridine(13) synthase TruD [Methylococcales bacterium]|nr:tRNA pseudouridine(13) synthase TruD [Methylococcales bacterium]